MTSREFMETLLDDPEELEEAQIGLDAGFIPFIEDDGIWWWRPRDWTQFIGPVPIPEPHQVCDNTELRRLYLRDYLTHSSS